MTAGSAEKRRSGGGEMTNMGCYAIDYAVSLLGRPRAVTAKWRKEWDVYKAADVEQMKSTLPSDRPVSRASPGARYLIP